MSANNIYALILAGGKGERFWPASRRNYPKHFLKILGKKSFLQETFSRLKSFVPKERIFIVTTKNQASLVKKQTKLRDKNIIIEPLGKNTAAAIGLGSMFIDKLNDDPVIVALPSDHRIEPKAKFIKAIKQAVNLAWEKQGIVSLGIKPTYPATGYGYIKTVHGKVERFTEKPSLPLAKKFIKTKSYFWNSGIFVFPASVILENIKKYQPRLYASLLKIEKEKSKTKIAKIYSKLKNLSIDYAVMEKTNRLYMLESNFKWDDVGSWASLEKYLKKDKSGNIISAFHHGADTKNCTIICPSGRLIAAMGLKNMLIVQTKDATLICPKDKSEGIKKIVENLSLLKQFKKYI